MIPLINDNIASFMTGGTNTEIAVTGFRNGCGVSTLAHALAAGFVAAGHKTCIVEMPTRGVNSSAFTQYMRGALGKTGEGAYTMLTEADDRTTYDRVIYDELPQGAPELTSCIYIAPEFSEDFELGVTCEAAVKFREKVQTKLSERWPDIRTEFVPIGRSAVNPQSALLAETDWMAIRALEAQFLQGTPLAELRHLLRTTRLNGWEPSP